MIELHTTRSGREFVRGVHLEAVSILTRVCQGVADNNGFPLALHEFISAAAGAAREVPPLCLHCGVQHTDNCPLAQSPIACP